MGCGSDLTSFWVHDREETCRFEAGLSGWGGWGQAVLRERTGRGVEEVLERRRECATYHLFH